MAVMLLPDGIDVGNFFFFGYDTSLRYGVVGCFYCGMTGVTLGLGSLGGSLSFFDRRYHKK